MPENGSRTVPGRSDIHGDSYGAAARDVWIPGEHPQAISELHWRRVDETRLRSYFENVTPVTGQVLCEIPRSNAADIDKALDAAHAAKAEWGKTSPAARARILDQIAQRMEDNLEMLATVETWDNGKPIRETMAADLPLAIDHFRYFAGCIRAQEGGSPRSTRPRWPTTITSRWASWGDHPVELSDADGDVEAGAGAGRGQCVVLKPAEQTPLWILVLMELIHDLLPPGVLNVVNGFGLEAGKPLASSARVNKVAFTGETTTGRLIMQYARRTSFR